MTRTRLRPAHSAKVLEELYGVRHDSNRWPDHRARIAATIDIIVRDVGAVRRAADLSCGNGALLDAVTADTKVYGDVAPGRGLIGPIEETLIGLEPVDLLIMCETLEHLDDPDAILTLSREKTAVLVLSTPYDEPLDRDNVEHYWSWSVSDVDAMLAAAGFGSRVVTLLPLGYYDFQIWVAR